MKISKVAMAKIQLVLVELVSKINNVESGVIATSDGMCLVSSDTDKEKQEKLAAMSSSLGALGEAVIREVSEGQYMSVTVEANNTKIFVLRISEKPAFTLMLVSNNNALIGEIMYGAKRYGSELRELFTLIDK